MPSPHFPTRRALTALVLTGLLVVLVPSLYAQISPAKALSLEPLSSPLSQGKSISESDLEASIKLGFPERSQGLIDLILDYLKNPNTNDRTRLRDSLSFSENCTLDYYGKRYKKNGSTFESKSIKSFGCRGWTAWAIDNHRALNDYYGGLEIGRTVALSIGGNETASLYTELVSDNVWIAGWAGYARVGFGALVSSSDSTTESTKDQFFQAGGNGLMYVQWPVYFFVNVLDGESTPIRRVDSFLMLSASSDIPALGTAVENFAWRLSGAFQVEGYYRAIEDKLRAFTTLEASLMYANGRYFDNLDVDAPKDPFLGVLKASVGVDIGELFRIGASFGTSTLFSNKGYLTVQLLPQQ